MRAMRFGEKLRFARIAPAMAAEFRRVLFQEVAEVRMLQNQRFLSLFHHACETVPFYRKKYKKAGVLLHRIKSVNDIHELPVLEKSELIEGFPEQVVSSQYQNHEKLFMFVTGGTSGQTLKILHSPESMYASLISYHRAYANMMGGSFPPSYRTAYVYTSPYPFKSIFGAYPHHFIGTLDPIDLIRSKLIKARPSLMTCYPSVLDKLTKELSAADKAVIAKDLKAISVNSEMSSQRQRDEWEEKWGVLVQDEFSSEEVSTVMFHQCRHKAYHIHQDLCVIESVDDDGKMLPSGIEGSLIVTALWNRAMPLIRYNQQDRVVLDDPAKTCGCGISLPLLRSFQGRINDAFTLPSGRVLSSGYLLDVGYAALVKYADVIKYWSLIQEAANRIVLECVIENDVDREFMARIKCEVSALFFDEASVEIRTLECIPRKVKGKHKQIYSLISGRDTRPSHFEKAMELYGSC